MATFEDFLKLELRAGTILEAEIFAEARKPALKMVIDFGPEIGRKKSSAQIRGRYMPDDIIGRQVVAVTNFPPRQIGPIMSEVLVTGFAGEDGEIVLIGPDTKVPNGTRLA